MGGSIDGKLCCRKEDLFAIVMKSNAFGCC